jgi:glycerol uptake facilitator-like aquaporin
MPSMQNSPKWFSGEFFGTFLLVIFCATDVRNAARPQVLTAATIGLTVTLSAEYFSLLGAKLI